MSTITGYKRDTVGSWIAKDPAAQLVYAMEWSDWLPTGAALATVNYTFSTVTGDASPLSRVSQGITGTQTYCEISGGSAGEIYTVTATITTDAGDTDVRRFRLKVDQRYL
jgi:hypothetical protein